MPENNSSAPLKTAEAYSLDADTAGIRALTADAITGALAFGAQGVNPPTAGHWLTPFWEMAQATVAIQVPQPQVEPAGENVREAVADLAAALDMFVGNNPLHSLCEHEGIDALGRVKGTWSKAAEVNAKATLKLHASAIAALATTQPATADHIADTGNMVQAPAGEYPALQKIVDALQMMVHLVSTMAPVLKGRVYEYAVKALADADATHAMRADIGIPTSKENQPVVESDAMREQEPKLPQAEGADYFLVLDPEDGTVEFAYTADLGRPFGHDHIKDAQEHNENANRWVVRPAYTSPVATQGEQPMVNMTPPATSRDRWMYEQGRLAEREIICTAIKAEDDHCVTEGVYMLDSDDCIKVASGQWVRPDYSIPKRGIGGGE
ncbi:MAG: hypothetical protein RSD57_13465 [Comamonas sp.]